MSKEAQYYRLALKIFTDFTGSIAILAVAGALAGKWLDGRYGTGPRYMIILLIVAFVISAFIIRKKAIKYAKEYESLNTTSSS